ncbi:protein of unknown function [Paraburkholderia kururiensis]
MALRLPAAAAAKRLSDVHDGLRRDGGAVPFSLDAAGQTLIGAPLATRQTDDYPHQRIASSRPD